MPLSDQLDEEYVASTPSRCSQKASKLCLLKVDDWWYSKSLCSLIALNVIIASGYMPLAEVVRSYFQHFRLWPAPLWLPAGLALFSALRGGIRYAPGIFLGSLATNLIQFHDSFSSSLLISLANTAGPILATAFARLQTRRRFSPQDLHQVTTLIFAALMQGATSALIALPSIAVKHHALLNTVPSHWLDWFLSDTAAALLVTPLLLVMPDVPRAFCMLERRAEFALTLFLGAITLFHLVSGSKGPDDAGSAFLVLVPLLWLAVRFSITIAYPLFAFVMTIIIMATMHGRGPFWSGGASGPIFVFAEMSVGFGMAILLLGSAALEQQRTQHALRELNRELENRVIERTAELQRSQSQLEQAALEDPLTGLPNRRSLKTHFAMFEATARRKNRPFTVMVIDLDHFKQINDHWGHDAGDAVLVETAYRLRSAIRQCDVVTRMGGDEFMLLLPETNERADVESVCERLSSILANPIVVKNKTIRTAASIGIAMFPGDAESWQTIYKAADLALYQAKRCGRGNWKCYHPSFADSLPISVEAVHA
jgi:diguanylate cyclase (GGDEF)-like protein